MGGADRCFAQKPSFVTFSILGPAQPALPQKPQPRARTSRNTLDTPAAHHGHAAPRNLRALARPLPSGRCTIASRAGGRLAHSSPRTARSTAAAVVYLRSFAPAPTVSGRAQPLRLPARARSAAPRRRRSTVPGARQGNASLPPPVRRANLRASRPRRLPSLRSSRGHSARRAVRNPPRPLYWPRKASALCAAPLPRLFPLGVRLALGPRSRQAARPAKAPFTWLAVAAGRHARRGAPALVS